MFSPRYFAARRARRASVEPLAFSSFHVALTGSPARFALTETEAVERSASSLRIGDSELVWSGRELRAEIDERTAFGREVKGTVRLDVPVILDHQVVLDRGARHVWTPLAPWVRAEVELTTPRLRFSGHAYVDANEGSEGLEDGFAEWSWARLSASDGGTTIAYDTVERDGHVTSRLFRAGVGGVDPLDPEQLSREALPTTLFRLRPTVRLDPGGLTRARTMQDAPFYCRTEIEGRACGVDVRGVHEWLDLRRYENPLVQRMIPYRMRGGFPRSGDLR